MRNVLSTIALIFIMIFQPIAADASTIVAPAQSITLPACQHEDGSIGTNVDGSTIYEDCRWDSTSGNGEGVSFSVVGGQYVYDVAPIPAPTTAPVIDHEADGWALFDAVGASSLLPAEGAQVSFIGYNQTGFPYLTADLITVWDNYGNHYLFSIG